MENSPLIFGIILQSSMILALGAQNIFVLEKGLTKDRPFLIATICSVCDVSLIMLGVLGAGSYFAQNEALSILLKLAGGTFLLKYASDKFHEAQDKTGSRFTLSSQRSTISAMIFSTLAVSLLNPHVYLDTIVLIGGYSTKYQELGDRMSFAIGAGITSICWFFLLSSCANYFSTALSKPKTMKYLNYSAAAIMSYLGLGLLLSA